MKTQRFDFNWKPLQMQMNISVAEGVADVQTLDTELGEYTPDYTLTPLVLQPTVGVIDRDGTITSGNINDRLTNVVWREVAASGETLITDGTEGYAVARTGDEAGRLTLEKNIDPAVPLTLRFEADYVDPRSSQVLKIRGSHMVRCKVESSDVRVEIDKPGQMPYNPLEDEAMMTVTPTIYYGEKTAPAGKYEPVWEVLDGDAWRTLSDEEALDFDVQKGENGMITIDRSVMGAGISMRCRAKKVGKAATEGDALALLKVVRQIPKFDYEMSGVPNNISADTDEVTPTVVITGAKGIIKNYDGVLLPQWYVARNTPDASLEYEHVADGDRPTIAVADYMGGHGCVLGVDVVVAEAPGAWTDADGKVLTDSDGAVIII